MTPTGSETLWQARGWELVRERQPEPRLLLLAPEAAPGSEERFDRAYVTLAAVQHPRVLRPTGRSRVGLRAALEFPDPGGQTLGQALANGPLGGPSAVRVVREIAEGLAALHDRGIIHRSVCPELVLLSGRGAVLVPGEAVRPAQESDVTRLGIYVAAEPPYTAPEMLRGDAATTLADAWALGIIAYVAITGELPVKVRDAFEFESAVRRGLPSLPEGTPPVLQQAYAGLTQTSPRQRWSSSRVVQVLGSDAVEQRHVPGPDKHRVVLEIRAGEVVVALPAVVGRTDRTLQQEPDLDLSRFDPDTTVSRRHARLSWDAGAVRVEDLGSRNGTRVNGQAIRAAKVAVGARLMFGSIEAKVIRLT